jgi:multiple sugar transport system substrate-binding protein
MNLRPLLACCCALALALSAAACRPAATDRAGNGGVTINFSHFKLPAADDLSSLLREFEQANPEVRVEETILPNSTDQQHQRYVVEFGAKATHLDVVAADVIWVSEFARAGWFRPLADADAKQAAPGILPAARASVTFKGKLYALPWFIDTGLLYYRKDLLARYGFKRPPETFAELVTQAKTVLAGEQDPRLVGFIWQGKQYEGLVCDFLEYLWGAGGEVLDADGRIAVDSPEARAALGVMRDLVYEHKLTPGYVTTFDEETSRRVFQNGEAVFHRNWPYVWLLGNQDDSPIKGKFGVTIMPHMPGKQSAATLGGWNLGVSAYSRHQEEAWKLVRFLTSPATQKRFAMRSGKYPTWKALYADAELAKAVPAIGPLKHVFMQARPRPVSPYYPQISAVLQSEVSAVLADVKDPDRAVRDMARQLAFTVLEQE